MKNYKRVDDDSWNFEHADTKSFTHGYHVYPAMMIPQVARKLIFEYRPEGRLQKLLDPYMGSGTSLVEASMAGIDSIGTDLNPLARLIARVKTAHYDETALLRACCTLESRLEGYAEQDVIDRDFGRITNHNYWYAHDSLLRLSFLTQTIDALTEGADFFRIALSEVVREASFTRNSEFKRFRMPENRIAAFRPDVFQLFRTKVERNLKGLREYNQTRGRARVEIHGFDSSIEIPGSIVPAASVDMVVTSPPYGDSRTTVAYGQFSRWANEWFGFEHAGTLDNLLMGGKKSCTESFQTASVREELDAIRAADVKRYQEIVSFLNDYGNSIRNVAATVRRGGVVCYVVGNRTVKGIQIPLDYFTAELFEQCGFRHQTTLVRKIPNKRMPSKTSPTNKTGAKVSTMSREYIVILTKER